MSPEVTVVILNYNGAHLLRDCIESLLAQDQSDLELIVVDNASEDNSRDIVASYQGVRWLGLSVNGGLGPGYNAGAAASSAETVFFINNDMRFEPDCVNKLLAAFNHENILAADPLQLDWEGKNIIHGAQRMKWRWRLNGFGVPFVHPYQTFGSNGNVEVPWGCAGALMFNKDKFLRLGGFDPTFFLDYEDLDICWRGWLRGWKTVFVPAARLYHKVGQSEDQHLSKSNPFFQGRKVSGINSRRQLSQCKNAQRFVLKTMPRITIIGFVLIEIWKIFGSLVRMRPQSGFTRLKALILNSTELPDIVRERKTILRNSVISSEVLLRHWASLP